MRVQRHPPSGRLCSAEPDRYLAGVANLPRATYPPRPHRQRLRHCRRARLTSQPLSASRLSPHCAVSRRAALTTSTATRRHLASAGAGQQHQTRRLTIRRTQSLRSGSDSKRTMFAPTLPCVEATEQSLSVHSIISLWL
ncbi:hypothetical protein EJK15_22735 [Nonomuraea basaltis]|nr:hypothetical protein EJK15_22735 [Nonomuraea basaltis]